MMRRPLRQQGFNLIEVMVSIVVIALGLVALAGLMTRSTQSASVANYRTQATTLAYVMADAMRGNLPGVIATNYSNVTTGAATDPGCAATGCTPAQEAQLDAFQWKQQVEAQLPGGEGIVCLDSTPEDGTDSATAACDGGGGAYVIKVFWRETRAASAPLQRFSVSFRP